MVPGKYIITATSAIPIHFIAARSRRVDTNGALIDICTRTRRTKDGNGVKLNYTIIPIDIPARVRAIAGHRGFANNYSTRASSRLHGHVESACVGASGNAGTTCCRRLTLAISNITGTDTINGTENMNAIGICIANTSTSLNAGIITGIRSLLRGRERLGISIVIMGTRHATYGVDIITCTRSKCSSGRIGRLLGGTFTRCMGSVPVNKAFELSRLNTELVSANYVAGCG